ncbi:hypothetical protein CLOM_g919 [Closterium sp. NIES-68]|nr:hypothetical protein CLOM_g919 [Closterium sp. NIES-68]GJP74548.1 hypothetical protein CLOP_g5110 [Closterium sp. NIES-67]
MEVIDDKDAMRQWSRKQHHEGRTVALVPTMGYLHEGHLSLVRLAATLADVVAVSVYVNPSQFAPHEDLLSYPRDLPRDLALLKDLPVAAVFAPTDLYLRPLYAPPDQRHAVAEPPAAPAPGAAEGGVGGHETWVTVERLQRPLCGGGRPVFFRGVATVVVKLLHIVEPDVAVFGKKDYQQWRLIHRMVRDLDMAVQVVGAPLLREADGLAMSSRNVRLTAQHRQQALSISRALLAAKAAAEAAERGAGEGQEDVADAGAIVEQVRREIEGAGGRVEYVQLVEQESLEPLARVTQPAVLAVAAHFGAVRLIDNVEIQVPQ